MPMPILNDSPVTPLIAYGEPDPIVIPGFISSRLMAAYDIEGHVLHVDMVGYTADNRERWRYILETPERVEIFDREFYSGCGDQLSYGDAARSALSWATTRPGDTDAEFFDGYTPGQLAWVDEHAENLSLYSLDPEG